MRGPKPALWGHGLDIPWEGMFYKKQGVTMEQTRFCPLFNTHDWCLSLSGANLQVTPALNVLIKSLTQPLGLSLPPGQPLVQRSALPFVLTWWNLVSLPAAQFPFHTISVHHADTHSYLSDPNEKGMQRLPTHWSISSTTSHTGKTLTRILPTFSWQRTSVFLWWIWILKNFILFISHAFLVLIPSCPL